MLITFFRAVLLYLSLILAIRLMGKRQLGQMEPSEFVVTLLIADLAAVPMQDVGISLFDGLVPIFVVLSLELLLSVWIYSSVRARKFFCGKPVILVEHGNLLQKNMAKTRINADELSEQLRLNGMTDLSQVAYAVLETNGSISILPEAQYAPAGAKDAGIQVEPAELPFTLINRGKLLMENLKLSGRDASWIEALLQHHNCSIRDVYLLTASRTGSIYLSIRKEN